MSDHRATRPGSTARSAPRRTLAWTAALMPLCLALPAQAVIGVYDTYFVSTEASSGSPGGSGATWYYNPRASSISALPGGYSGGASGMASNAGSSTDTSGRLTGATSYVSSTGFSNGFLTGDSNTSFASADLASGELRAGVLSDSSGAGYVAGQAYAEMHDIVTLNVAGADAGTRTRVTVQYAVDGTYASSGPMPGGNLPIVLVEASFCLGNPSSLGCVQPDYGLHARAVAQWNPNVPSTVVPTLIGAENSFNLATGLNGSGSWEGSTAERMVFTGSFDIIGASITLNPTMVLNLNCSLASCDFGHTAQFRFIDLPSHVTYSSDSGVFLTAVPEPGTWALMLAGLGAVGSLARRRQGRQR